MRSITMSSATVSCSRPRSIAIKRARNGKSRSVPRNATVAGVPAKVVGSAGCAEPARQMDQLLSMMEGI